MSLQDAWETRAADWVRWARSPELDDDFWSFHLPEFLHLVPAPGHLTVDVGCGEGRLGRVLTKSGHAVVGFDASVTSVRAAATHPEGHPAAVADAVRLPLPDNVADLAIAFMSLHDFDDVRAAVAEVARVLSPDGRFCVALLHPALTARMVDGYAVEQRYSFTVERAGLQMTYEGTHRPLGFYFDALEAARFMVEALREPVALRDDGSPYVNFVHIRGRLLGPTAQDRRAVAAARRAEGRWREARPQTRPDEAAQDRVVGQGLCGRDRIRTCVGNAGDFTGRTTVAWRVPSYPDLVPIVAPDVHKRPFDSFRCPWASLPVPSRPLRPIVRRREGGGKSRRRPTRVAVTDDT
jgi:SAM-dependent methyltransferase